MTFIPRPLLTALWVMLLIIFIGGCATKPHSTVSTNRSPTALTKIKKVLFIISVDGTFSLTDASKFQEDFISSLRQKMQSYCVQSSIVEVNKLELIEGQAARKAIADFQPSDLLEVNFVPGVSFTGQDFKIYHGKLRFALSDATQRRIVWRGDVLSRLPSEPEKINTSIKEFTDKMQQDGVLGNLCARSL